jgi:amino acid transporter
MRARHRPQHQELHEPGMPRRSPHVKTLRNLLIGPPIHTAHSDHTRLSKTLALPIFSSDAISSVAYATQEILLALGAAGLAGAGAAVAFNNYLYGVTAAIVVLLAIVAFSYRQTIFAYPNGGGSYIVTKDNLGVTPGLIAAAALLIDYVLTVAVSIASGVQNLLGTPFMQQRFSWVTPEGACLFFVVMLTFANLRGLKESGKAFAVPTYLFIVLAYITVGLGLGGSAIGWHLHLENVNHTLPPGYVAPGAAAGLTGLSMAAIFVGLRAFANGCSAMTGTEAISNGIPAFQRPESKNAATTLIAMAIILGSLFIGTSMLAARFGIVYWERGNDTAPAVIDQMSAAVFGRDGTWAWMYYAMQLATVGILVLAANTSYADFPRLSSILAHDLYLPRELSHRGDRLVFSRGILLLGFFSALLIVMFHGSVDQLIPLYALGVFTAFTFSQSGMVVHWIREGGPGWQAKAVVNGLGAFATAIVFLVILREKAPEGAWIVVVVAGILVYLFKAVHRQYEARRTALRLDDKAGPDALPPAPRHNTVVVLVAGVHRGSVTAVNYARLLSHDIRAVYVAIDPDETERVERLWKHWIPDVPLIIRDSPYRSLVGPILDYVDAAHEERSDDIVTLVIPEAFYGNWLDTVLRSTAGPQIKLALLGRDDVVVVNVRYRLNRNYDGSPLGSMAG